VYTEFHQRWPIPKPSSEEISATGSLEKVRSEKQKKSETVCHHSSYLAGAKYFVTCQQIKNWLYNRREATTSHTGTRGVLSLGPPPRLLHSWQAFSKLFAEELKPRVAEEWKNFCARNPDTTSTPFAHRNSLMKKWHAEASPEVKAKVESFRQEQRSNSGEAIEGSDETSQIAEYQK